MSQSHTWSIKDFYKKSWTLTLKHKKLWIIALALAVGSSGNGGGGGSSSSVEEDSKEKTKQESSVDTTEQSDIIDGDSEKETEPQINQVETLFNNFIEKDIKTTPLLLTLTFLGVQLLILLVWSIAYSIILRSWATAALIRGVSDADTKDQVDLGQISKNAMSSIKSVAWITVVPGLYLTLIALFATAIIFAIMFIAKPSTLIMAIIILISVIALVYAGITIFLSTIWAIRYATLENKNGKDAFLLGHKTIKGNIGKMFSLGFVNALSSTLAGLVVIIPFGSVGIAAAIPAIQAQKFTLDLAITLAILFIAMIPTISITNAAMTVFKFSTWHYGFKITKKS